MADSLYRKPCPRRLHRKQLPKLRHTAKPDAIYLFPAGVFGLYRGRGNNRGSRGTGRTQ